MRWVLAFALLLAGCGLSYQDALNTYNAEVAALERIEKERDAARAEYKEKVAEFDKMEQGLNDTENRFKRIGTSPSPKIAESRKTLYGARMDTAKAFDGRMEEFDRRIAAQQERVKIAFEAKEKLAR